jgi:predicted flavoprotein YhiN
LFLSDAIGVAFSVATLPFNVRNLWSVVSKLRSFSAQSLSFEALRSMNRLERLRALSRVFQDATRTEQALNEVMAAAREAQIGARTFQQTNSLSVNQADTLVRVIQDQTVKRLETALLNVLGGAATPAMSATPARITGSASGSINYLIHLLDAGRPNL